MNSLFLSPHNDDAALFGSFILLREKPLVLTITDSYIQQNRGENITPEQRRQEDIEAMKILGCPIVFGAIRDDIIEDWGIYNLLSKFHNFTKIYAPAPIIPGNQHHNLIGKIAGEVFKDKVTYYMTYSTNNLYIEGSREIKPTEEELAIKSKALKCYQSQLNLEATRPHFEAMEGRSEWYI